jgi:hypothetical protein
MNSHAYIGYSFQKLFIWKYWTLRRFLGEVRRTSAWSQKSEILKTRSLKGSCGGPALIAATGPSHDEVPDLVFEFFKNRKSIFGVNNYILSDKGVRFPPTYQFIIDNAFIRNRDIATEKHSMANVINSVRPDYIVQVAGAQDYLRDYPRININGHVLPSFIKSIDPTKVCGFVPNTTLFAISLAIYLGFSPIFVTGFDYDQFKEAKVNFNLEGIYVEDISPFKSGPDRNKWEGRENSCDLFGSVAYLIETTKLFQGHDVKLIGDKGVVDTFERIDIDSLLQFILK